jgi:nucleoside-diphosphate-sugar epimerase
MDIKKILVTGATGRTGSLVLKKLRQQLGKFIGLGLARSQAKVEEIFGSTENFFLGDIQDREILEKAMAGCQALVILTSAVPQMQKPPTEGEKPAFTFAPGGMPEEVDWLGQKNQIDVAKQVGVEQIVCNCSGGVIKNALHQNGGNQHKN